MASSYVRDLVTTEITLKRAYAYYQINSEVNYTYTARVLIIQFIQLNIKYHTL